MSTIMQDAANGVVTEQFKTIAKKEGVTERFLMDGIASGRIVAPSNPNHDPIPSAIAVMKSIPSLACLSIPLNISSSVISTTAFFLAAVNPI